MRIRFALPAVIAATAAVLAVGAVTTAAAPAVQFGAKTDYSTAAGGGHTPGRLAIGDLNDDGCNDVVVANTGGTATAVILFGTPSGVACTGSLGSPTALSLPNPPRDIRLGDLDGDGCLDIVTANNTSSISRFLNTKTAGACTGSFGTVATYTAYQQASGLALADLNGDSCLDVASAAWASPGGWENPSKVSVFLGNRSGATCLGTLGAYTNYSIGLNGQGPLAVAAGDINADGCLDLVTANRRSFDKWSSLIGACDGTFATGVLNPGTGKGEAEDVALADLNGDGHLDLVGVTTGQTDSPTMIRIGGDGTGGVAVGSFRPAAEYGAGSGTNPEVVGVADVNDDGNLDVLIGYYSATYVSVYAGNGDGTLEPKADFNATGSTTGLALGDMNGDGSPDIVAANRTNPGSLSVLLNQTSFTRSLSVATAGTGAGSVTSSPSGISCGVTCTASFASGTAVTLTATPAANSTFSGWDGACSGTGTCTVSMTRARSVTATFAAQPASGGESSDGTSPTTGRLAIDLDASALLTRDGTAGRFTASWTADGGPVAATTITLRLPAGTELADGGGCARVRSGRIEIAVPALASGATGSCTFTVRSATTRRIALKAVAAGAAAAAAARPRAVSAAAWVRAALAILETGEPRARLDDTLDAAYAGRIARGKAARLIRRHVAAIRRQQVTMATRLPLPPASMAPAQRSMRRALALSLKADLAFIAWLGGDDDAMKQAITYSDLATEAKQRLLSRIDAYTQAPPNHWAI